VAGHYVLAKRGTCQGQVPRRPYSPAGPCQITVGVQVVRWAPTPLRTKVYRLCAHHRKQLEAGKLMLVSGQVAVAA